MPLDPNSVGATTEATEVSWTSTDALLYAIGVGAGLGDPCTELEFTTENSIGIEQKVLPTFAVVQQGGQRPDIGTFDWAGVLHGSQSVRLHRPLPPDFTVRAHTTVKAIYDKGSAGVAVFETRAVDPADGSPVYECASTLFIRGAGGFGGDRGPSEDWQRPDRVPDHQVTYQVRPEQALLYRLSGDRNPLHSDPAFAAKAGFDRPILHGLCTYGFTGRALLHALCGSDPARFGSMEARFSKPVMPGENLNVLIWRTGEGSAAFQTVLDNGSVVLDRGNLVYT